MRRVYIDLTVRLIIDAPEGVDIDEVVNEMEYDLNYIGDQFVSITDTEITDYKITDSK